MARNPKTGALEPAKNAEELLSYVPKVKREVDLEKIVTVFNKDSSNLLPQDWEAIVGSVWLAYHGGYDAIIVSHGTDTMAYSASAVAFALRNINRPIVFTGSQSIPDKLGSDAAFNLENAFRVAMSGIAEVVISFGHEVHRAVRATKIHESDYYVFGSPITGPLIKIRDTLEIQQKIRMRKENLEPDLNYWGYFASGILSVRSDPPMEPWMIEKLLLAQGRLSYSERSALTAKDASVMRGIVLEALGAGNIPEQYHDLIRTAVEDYNVPVIVTSPFIGGSAAGMGTYASGLGALKAGAISAGDMTVPAATVKLSWALSRIDDQLESGKLLEENALASVAKIFRTNYIGEVTLPKKHR